MSECDLTCMACSGEICMTHGHEPCDCDTADRHCDGNNTFIGKDNGMEIEQHVEKT